jgi:hypothetical protein
MVFTTVTEPSDGSVIMGRLNPQRQFTTQLNKPVVDA